jgi:hypothetical protein
MVTFEIVSLLTIMCLPVNNAKSEGTASNQMDGWLWTSHRGGDQVVGKYPTRNYQRRPGVSGTRVVCNYFSICVSWVIANFGCVIRTKEPEHQQLFDDDQPECEAFVCRITVQICTRITRASPISVIVLTWLLFLDQSQSLNGRTNLE